VSGPLVSVVLGTFNQAPYIEQAIESVLAQTHGEIELIIVDNGSTDGTTEIVMGYAARPNVLIQHHDENGPVTARLNRALDAARGEFVSFLFGDDYYLADKTARQLARFGALGPEYGVVYGPGFRLNARTGRQWLHRGRGPSGWVAADLLTHFHSASLNPIAPLIRASALSRHRFHEEIFLEGTESVLLRLSLSCKFSYLPEPLVVMRDHPTNWGKAFRKNVEYNFLLLDLLRKEPSFPESLTPVLVSVKAQALRSLGWTTVRLTDEGATARGYFRDAIRLRRRQAFHPRTLVGLALSFVPRGVRRALNAVGFRLRRHRAELGYVRDA